MSEARYVCHFSCGAASAVATKLTIAAHPDPWEYPDGLLVTLCEHCHEEETELWQEVLWTAEEVLKDQWFSGDAHSIVCSLHNPCVSLDVVPHMLHVLLQTEDGEPIRKAYEEVIRKLNEKDAGAKPHD